MSQGEKGEPGEQGPPAPWWQLLLLQLPAILTGLAACIGAWGAWSTSRQNAARLEQHGEVIEKAAVDMGQVSKTVSAIEVRQEKASRGP